MSGAVIVFRVPCRTSSITLTRSAAAGCRLVDKDRMGLRGPALRESTGVPDHVRPHDARRTATGRSGLVRIRRLRRCEQFHDGRVFGAAFRDVRALASAFFSRLIARPGARSSRWPVALAAWRIGEYLLPAAAERLEKLHEVE
jgi:hypothetical protein